MSPRNAVIFALLAVIAALGCAGPASAATPTPAWALDSYAYPSNFSAADNALCESQDATAIEAERCDSYTVTATNIGGKAMSGTVKMEDTLPTGLTVRAVSLLIPRIGSLSSNGEDLGTTLCTFTSATVKCTISNAFLHERNIAIKPGEKVKIWISVIVGNGVPLGQVTNQANVSGGGATTVSTMVENSISPTPSPFGFTGFSASPFANDGTPATQAGAHPEAFDTTIDLNSSMRETPEGSVRPTSVEDVRDVYVDLPLGLAGSAVSAPTCTMHQLVSKGSANEQGVSGCPKDAIVGAISSYPNGFLQVFTPIFNIVPERGVAAEFGFIDGAGTPHMLYASLAPTPAGYVLRTSSREIAQVPLTQLFVNFYGDPAAHNGSSVEPHVPTFTSPADCSGQPLVSSIHMDSYAHPGTYNADGSPNFADPNWAAASSESPPVTGCNQLEGLFEPELEATPETNRADAPTGLDVNLRVPQTEGTETLGTPPLRKAVVTLPEGMTVNPSSANGLTGCSLSALGMSASGLPDAAAPNCPDASKIGTVELETPALPGVLQGQIYVAKQTENPFHNLLAIYIVVDDPTTGVVVKLPGEITANPATGQLSTVVDNSPQFPFSELRTHFFGGQRAALRTPSVCGKYTVTSSLTPWSAPESGSPATPTASFEITQGCASSAATEPNHPAFSAGTLNPLAGAYSPFVLKLSREDGSQELKGLNLTLPQGLVGKLAGLSYCPEAALASVATKTGAAEQASPSCPAGSEVGVVNVGAGAGLEPYYATGHAYLAGPYKGAPLSLAIITPAVAGPYDLGDVLVRNALQVDPGTAQITAVSDEIPHILQGIPLDVRSIALQMNRPDFTLNPTNCEKMAVTGTATSVLGLNAPLTNPFQVGGCKQLGFKPKLTLAFKGGTRRTKHPALKSLVTYPKGSYANIAKAAVTLPGSEIIDQDHIGNPCTRPVFDEEKCPKISVLGRAKAWSPLLDQPLEGKVYFRANGGERPLPDVVADLRGQIHVVLVGAVDTVTPKTNPRIRTTFFQVPDAPVSKFTLELKGGKEGLLVNSENICKAPQAAVVKLTAQNGKVDDFQPLIANGCKPKHGGGHKRQAGRAVRGLMLGGW